MFDILIVTQLPSFYKINLYNKLSLEKNIHVIFIGNHSVDRQDDFIENKINFSYTFLNKKYFENRSIIKSVLRLLFLLKKIKHKYTIINGWDLVEFWTINLFDRKIKGLVVESTIYESTDNGLKLFLKKIFLKNIDFVLPSGIPHKNLILKLGYKKRIFITGGVGIIDFIDNKTQLKVEKKIPKSFIFVGRLCKEKNIELMIEVFNRLPNFNLTIIGSGNLDHKLKSLKKGNNIKFIGHIKKNNLSDFYLNHDVLILPSISETWGLVVEEAIYFGLPVIVSDIVGSSLDLVLNYNLGLLFKTKSSQELYNAINSIAHEDVYYNFCINVSKYNKKNNFQKQVDAYSLNWYE